MAKGAASWDSGSDQRASILGDTGRGGKSGRGCVGDRPGDGGRELTGYYEACEMRKRVEKRGKDEVKIDGSRDGNTLLKKESEETVGREEEYPGGR